MKVLGIDHIGIATNSIDEVLPFYEDALKLKCEGKETVAEQKTTTAFIPVLGGEIELLESTQPDGPVAKFVAKKGEGIHHICLRVENIEEAIKSLKEKGVKLIDEKPRIGAGGAKVAFIHPKSTFGILIELSER